MSLLIGPNNQPLLTLTALWKAAHESSAGEPEALSFWQHYISKHEFKDEHWICDAEIRPQPGSRRRVDSGVRFLSTGNEILVLCWLEAKGSTAAGDISECEEQALRACKENLESHPWQKHIFALTTARTTAKAWMFERGDDEMKPIFPDRYIEANSSDGIQIKKCFERMKALIPATVAGYPDSTRVTQTTIVSQGSDAVPRSQPGVLFPRPGQTSDRPSPATTSPMVKPTAANITKDYLKAEARRHPTDRQALQFKTTRGWTTGKWKKVEVDGRTILYSDELKVWTEAKLVQQ